MGAAPAGVYLPLYIAVLHHAQHSSGRVCELALTRTPQNRGYNPNLCGCLVSRQMLWASVFAHHCPGRTCRSSCDNRSRTADFEMLMLEVLVLIHVMLLQRLGESTGEGIEESGQTS